MFKVVVAQPLDEVAERRLAESAEIIRPAEHTEEGLCTAISDAQALIARTHTPVTARVLEAGPRLKVVGVAGVGLDRVDVAAAERLCISVVNRPGAATQSVAELTILLMLSHLRPIGRLSAAYAAGGFQTARKQPHGPELSGQTVGVVGMGRIGRAVGRLLASGFGCRVLYNDIVAVNALDFAAEPVEKSRIWAESDLVTLHVPLTDQTRRLIDSDVLRSMRPGAILINTARGAVVDTAALTTALQSRQIAGAGLDVTDPEPLPLDHPLFSMDNCILTPHIAARTHGGLRRMYDVVDDVLAVLQRGVDPQHTAQ